MKIENIEEAKDVAAEILEAQQLLDNLLNNNIQSLKVSITSASGFYSLEEIKSDTIEYNKVRDATADKLKLDISTLRKEYDRLDNL